MLSIKFLFLLTLSHLFTPFIASMEGPEERQLQENSSQHEVVFPQPRFSWPIQKIPNYVRHIEADRNHKNLDKFLKQYVTALEYAEFLLESEQKEISFENFVTLCHMIMGLGDQIKLVLNSISQLSDDWLKNCLIICLEQIRIPIKQKAYFIKEINLAHLIQLHKLSTKCPKSKRYHANETDFMLAQKFYECEDDYNFAFTIEETILQKGTPISPDEEEITPPLTVEEKKFFQEKMTYSPAPYDEIVQRWVNAIEKLNEMLKQNIHPIKCASYIHNQITAIHGFRIGNGRIARLMLNLVLMLNNYPPIAITNTYEYRHALRQGDNAFTLFIIKKLNEAEYKCHQCLNQGDKKARLCTGCHAAQYCSTQCQREAWDAGHKNICNKMKISKPS